MYNKVKYKLGLACTPAKNSSKLKIYETNFKIQFYNCWVLFER